MSDAPPGTHYCESHQGNTSHYDPKNCTVCRLEAALLQKRENAHAESCRIRALTGRVYAAEAEVERLKAGGCARDQRTTQFCAEAVRLQERLSAAEAKLEAIEGLPEKESKWKPHSYQEGYVHGWNAFKDEVRAILRGEDT